MGIFQEMVTVINLAPVPLSVMYDGQQTTVPVGTSQLPKVCILLAKNQNPEMGSCDPRNPSVSGGRYLIAVKGHKADRQKPLTPEEWQAHLDAPSRLNTTEMFEDILNPGERVVTRGKGRALQARSLFEAGVKGRTSVDETANPS